MRQRVQACSLGRIHERSMTTVQKVASIAKETLGSRRRSRPTAGLKHRLSHRHARERPGGCRQSARRRHRRLPCARRAAQPLSLRVVFRFTRNTEDTQDVVQDIWLKVHAQLGRFEARSDVRTWLTRIAVNCAIDHLRSTRRREATYDPVDLEEHVADVGVSLRSPRPIDWCSRVKSGRASARRCRA